MIEGFLAYPPGSRLTAKDALANLWFADEDEGPLILPVGYPLDKGVHCVHEIEGNGLGDILGALVQAQENLIETMDPRSEWD